MLVVSRQNGGIVLFDNALTVTGSTLADRVVEGPNSGLEAPISFAYDGGADRLFVGNINAADGILVFDNPSDPVFDGDFPTGRGFAPSDRSPFFTTEMTIDAMDFDADGNLWVSDTSGLNVNSSRVLVFADAGAADGAVNPVRTIDSAWGNIEDLTVRNNVLFVVDGSENVYIFENASTLDGDVTPSATITVNRSLATLDGIVVGADGVGYLADENNMEIHQYDDIATRTGTLVPDRTFEDDQVGAPRQMWLVEP